MRGKRLFFTILMLVTLLLAACAAQPTEAPAAPAEAEEAPAEEAEAEEAPAAEVEPIKIGFVGDLSGDWAQTDTPYLDGAKFAVDEINEAGGVLGRPLEIVERDCKDDAPTNIRYTQELVDDGIVYFLGTVGESLVAGGKVACEAGVAISTGIGSADVLIDDMGDCAFQVMFADTTQGAVAAEYAYNTLGYRTAYILLSTEFPYVENLPRYFETTFEKLGGEVIGEDQFIYLGGDYSAQATTLAAIETEPDVIYTSMIVPDTNLFMRQLRAAGVNSPVIGPDGFDNVGILDAGEVVEGVLFTTSAMDVGITMAFYDAYEAKTGKRPDVAYYADSYDEIYMLKQIIEKAGAADAAAVLEGLKTMSGFEGVTGDWDMGADRRVDRPIVIIGIENNQYNFVELMVPEWKPDP